MKRFFERLITASLTLWCLSGNAQAEPFRVVIFGDSLTSGYELQPEQAFAAKLQRKIKEVGFDAEVINMSVAGETTAGGMERVNSVNLKRPDIVVVELGANDALRGLDISVMQRNLNYIIDRLESESSKPYIILVGMQAPLNMGYAYTQSFNAVYPTIVNARHLPLYPFALEGVFGHPDMTLADSFHPNSKGVDVMVEGIYPYVDAGLRYKWDSRSYQSDYQQTTGTAAPIVSSPVAADPTAQPAAQ